MTFTEAAEQVLRLAGKPLHYKEITELAVEKDLLSHVGKSPDVTMGARLAAMLKKDDTGTAIVRVRPGVFALREWNGKSPGPAPATPDLADTEEGEDTGAVNALEVEAAAAAMDDDDAVPTAPRPAALTDSDEDDAPVPEVARALSQDEARRANLAASGADLFDDEDDDDQPIFGARDDDEAQSAEAGDAAGGDAAKRKRRRRRRGRGRAGDEPR